MANNTTNFILRLRTQGLDEAQRQTQVIRDNLEAAARAAAQVGGGTPGTSTPAAGGTPSSRRVAASRAARPTGAAGASAGVDMEEADLEGYTRARGVAGTGGAAGRNFADQARGLGGFVRLYATLAANAFAAQAAFTALSRAMDTQNMVKGLDQLGGASGKNLSALSRDLVTATGSAISLRTSMEAVAKASSAGLSSEQIVKIGEGAARASVALGVDLNDAINRLTRGISKLEPELLDELGIYVKIDDAVQKYALSIGKASSTLTDFERRQAFAVEALGQLNRKFSDIEIDANPYNKLLATFNNLATSAGKVLNTVLAPIVKYLSESPVALGLAVAGIATALVKQAIPAFGEFRANLDKTLTETRAKATELYRLQQESAGLKQASAGRAAFEAFKVDPQNVQKLQQAQAIASSFTSTTKRNWSELAKINPFTIDEQDFENWKKSLEGRAKQISRTNAVEAQQLRDHVATMTALRLGAIQADEAAQEAAERQDAGRFSQETTRRVLADRANRAYANARILEIAETTRKTDGLAAGWKKLNEELKKPTRKIIVEVDGQEIEQTVSRLKTLKEALEERRRRQQQAQQPGPPRPPQLGGPDPNAPTPSIIEDLGEGIVGSISLLASKVRGGLGLVLNQAIDFGARFGPYIAAGITVAVAAFEFLDAALSTNKKQLQEFSSALEGVDSSTKLVDDTLKQIGKRENKFIDAKSVEALGNALKEVGDKTQTLLDKFEELDKASSGWDNLKNWFAGLINKDRETELAKGLENQINNAFKLIQTNEQSEELRKKLESVLGPDGLDFRAIRDKIKKEGVDGAIREIGKALDDTGEKAAKAGNNLKDAIAALDKVNTSYQGLQTSLVNTSPLATFATSMVDASVKMTEAFNDPINSLNIINKILTENSTKKFFSADQQKQLEGLSSQVEELTKKAKEGRDAVFKRMESQIQDEEREAQRLAVGQGSTPSLKTDAEIRSEARKRTEQYFQTLESQIKGIQVRVSGIFDKDLVVRAANIITAEFQREIRKAKLEVTSGILSILPQDTMGMAKAQFEIQKEQVALEIQSIESTLNLIAAVEKNSKVLEQRSIEEKLKPYLEAQSMGIKLSDEDKQKQDKLENSLKELQNQIEYLNSGISKMASQGRFLSLSPESQKALLGTFQAAQGAASRIAGQRGKLEQARVTADVGTLKEEAALREKSRNFALETNKLEQKRFELLDSILGGESLSILNQKQRLETSNLELENQQQLAKFELDLQVAQKARLELSKRFLRDESASTKASLETANNAVTAAEEQLKREKALTEEKSRQLVVTQELEKLKRQENFAQKEIQFERELISLKEQRREIEFDSREEAINRLEKFDLISKKQAVDELAAIKTEREVRSAAIKAREAEEVAADARRKARLAVQSAEAVARPAAEKTFAALPEDQKATTSVEAIIAQDKGVIAAKQEEQRIETQTNAILGEKLKLIQAGTAAKLASIEATRAEQSAVAQLTDTFGKLAEVLGALGETGKRFGDAIMSIAKAQSDYEQKSVALSQDTANKKQELNKQMIAAYEAVANDQFDTEEDRNKSIQDVREKFAERNQKLDAETAKKGTKLELDRNIAVLNSSKKMFKEKTAAYKAIDAVEKGMHVYKMLMLAKEMGMEAVAAAKSFASSLTGLIGKGGEAVANQGAKGDPYTAFARMAAMAAAIGSLISSIGGSGGPKVQAGSSAAERQEVQGTGMEWRDGQKVETGRGVFGDPEAKSDSVRKSLERIKDTNVEGITYASRTVKLLESIDKAIGGAAQELYGVQGLRAGTAFGTQEGTSSSGIQGLFGSRRSTEIIDAGIKFAGSFLDVMMARAGSIMQYETTRTTKTSSGFLGIGGGTSTWENTLEKDLGEVNQTAAREVSKIFTNAGDLMIELGGQLGQTQEQVLSSLSRVDLTGRFASLRGLKGEELQKELSAVISSILDDAATVAFRSLEKFRKFGEGMAETVIRVLDTNQKINDSFVAMGAKTLDTMVQETFGNTQVTEKVVKSVSLPMDQLDLALRLGFKNIAEVAEVSFFGIGETVIEEITRPISEAELKQKSLEISEGLAELAGGLDKFLEKQKFFTDNFLTEAERLDPIRRGLTDQLNKLGLGFVDTREEFKQVVLALGQNVTTEGGRELYNAVLDLAPAFNQVYEEVEDVKEALSTLELRNKLLDQELTILGLLGKEEEVLAIKRNKELTELRKYPGVQGELLAANQEYIYALEDEKKAKDALIKRRQEVENTVKSLTSAIDALSKYKTSLLTGSLTTLSPQQQYQENRTQFEQLQQKLAAATTNEERTQLLSQLQGVSDKFLESSRGLFASSSTYAADFQSVMNTIDTYSAVLTAQKTDAEMQLEELTAHGITLSSIETNTKTTSELLNTYLLAQDASKQEDLQRQELRQQWEESLLTAMTTVPEITLDIKPVVDELVNVKNELIKQQTAQAEQNNAAVAVNHTDLQSILSELEKLRAAYAEQTVELGRSNYDPMPANNGY